MVLVTCLSIFLRESDFIQGLLMKNEWISTVLGNFHPIILHLPIGIVFLVTSMEVMS